MSKSVPSSEIINIHALAELMGSEPEDVKRAGQQFFTRLSSRDGGLSDAMIAASRGSKVKPKQMKSMLDLFAEDFKKPLPEQPKSLSERLTNAVEDVRDKASETVERITSGVASIDVAALRQEGADKVAELRERAAAVEASDLADQAKEMGDKAITGARDLASKVGKSIASVMPKNETNK